ncbi:hypothetical protein BAU15_08230 [Enterococcus sp. JM4C]|uniref:helix-turn-helix domain-containing protein n=1 Tax=Candidatus Enterococcus huntleyi TaxID=1857217 RepID=UPI00137AF491|nr:helix-turn-helix transcriptional regulator [Enterococcus sp. JM4C]KAF1297882.1 hypothetical protein BAU15_08230 [Enterococcus sp. JM4C]
MEFSEMIKGKRKELGLTQEELAEKLSVSRSAVSNWEIGRNYPDIQTLIILSKTFGVSIDDLLDEDKKIVEAIEFDSVTKRNWKRIIIVALVALTMTTFSTIYLMVNRQPSIHFVKENQPADQLSESKILPFEKEEIKEVYMEGQQLMIVVDASDQIVGYMVDGSGDELTVSLSKEKRAESKKSFLFDGRIKIDLSDYSGIKNIRVNHQ